MLKKQNRLRGEKDFEKIIKKGERFWDIFLFLKVIKNNLRIVRVGLVISRKVSKKAVERNRIKRQLSEILRIKINEINSGYDLVFFVKKGIKTRSFSEIKESVEALLKSAKIYSERKWAFKKAKIIKIND